MTLKIGDNGGYWQAVHVSNIPRDQMSLSLPSPPIVIMDEARFYILDQTVSHNDKTSGYILGTFGSTAPYFVNSLGHANDMIEKNKCLLNI